MNLRVTWFLILAPSFASADLKVGDILPDCSKIPLLDINSEYRPNFSSVASLESSLLSNGVAIVHFCSPRQAGTNNTRFIEELADIKRAAMSVSYMCNPIAIIPLGQKGRDDVNTILSQNQTSWSQPQIFYEPTFPRPGLYRTFRSSNNEGSSIATPCTYLIGPGRTILAVRGPEDKTPPLAEWLEANLPSKVTPITNPPSTNLSLPATTPWNWAAFRRNAQRQPIASMLPDVLPYTYLAWQATVGRTFASPVVVDNVVYVNTDARGLQSLALDSGRPLQSFVSGPSWWSSPVVAGDLVYTISSEGMANAVDRGTFKPRWRKNLKGLVTSSPVVNEGVLYIGSRNGSVYALDAANGEILWQFQTGGEISSSPALADGILVIGSGDRSVYAIDAKNGGLKWVTPTDGPVDSSPTIAGGDLYVGSFDGSLYAMKMVDGSITWRCPLGGWVHSSPAVDDENVFVGTVSRRGDEIATFNWVNRKTGKKSGSFDTPDSVYSSPTVWGDMVLVGCRDHRLYAFDRKMRQVQPAWSYKMRSYIHASPVVVGDTVLVASFEGAIYALRQAKPIRVWKDEDIVPRWFVAALSKELHKGVSDLIARASSGKVGEEHSLRKFDAVFGEIRSGVKGEVPKVLPSDVPVEHPGASYIEYALTSGLLTGHPDGSFRPNEPTTRYQFAGGLATALQTISRPTSLGKLSPGRSEPRLK